MYTAKSVREALWEWGEAVKHGYFRGHTPHDPLIPRLATHFGPRLPCWTEYLDLSRAFASLSPATRGLANTGDLSWYVHVRQVTRPQQVLWLYYVGNKEHDAWGARKFRQDWQAMSPEARSLLLDLEAQHPGRHVLVDDLRGDDLIAARLRVSRRTVYYDRNRAIEQMVAFLQPERPSASAA